GPSLSGALLRRAPLVGRGGAQPLLEPVKLVQQRAGKVPAKRVHRSLDLRPERLPGRRHDGASVLRERHHAAALIIRRLADLDEAGHGELAYGPCRPRLRHADGLRQFANAERAQPVEGGKIGKLTRLHRQLCRIDLPLRGGLKTIAYPFQTGAERQISERLDDILDHARRPGQQLCNWLYNMLYSLSSTAMPVRAGMESGVKRPKRSAAWSGEARDPATGGSSAAWAQMPRRQHPCTDADPL